MGDRREHDHLVEPLFSGLGVEEQASAPSSPRARGPILLALVLGALVIALLASR